MKRLLIASLTVLAISAGAAGTAAALTRYTTTVKIEGVQLVTPPAKRAAGTFILYGSVSSSKGSCRNDRKVLVYYRASANGKRRKLGSTRSDSGGRWAFQRDFARWPGAGYYNARAPKRKLSNRKLCKAGGSPTFAIGG